MNRMLHGLCVWVMVLGVFTGSAWSQTPAKVLILPPVLHGSADMAFLQQGVVDMLATRLAAPGKVTVLAPPDGVPEAARNQDDALAKGRQQGADYVVFGSLTLLGGGISTDLRMVAPADKKLALSFSRSGKDHAALITHMDQFAAQVNQQVFGLTPAAPADQAKTPQPKAAPPAMDPIYQHPEKLLTGPLAGEEEQPKAVVRPKPGFRLAKDQGAVRGPRINAQIQGVALGDLTGDGNIESVYVGRHSVWIYRYVNGRFAKMAHIKGSGNYVGVDTADLDGDGRAEIFVTNVDNSDGQTLSFVLAYNGRTFVRQADKLDLYFRAVNLPRRGRVLLGQRSGIDDFFAPGIYEVAFKDGKYYRETRFKAPSQVNVYGMGVGTFSIGEGQQVAAFSQDRYLKLLSLKGTSAWKSSEPFGGTAVLIKGVYDAAQDEERMRYLEARIETHDFDGDGVDEVVVMRNEDQTGSVLARTRYFKNGRLEVLKADALGLAPYWQTRNMAKFVSDFALADLDGDGNMEIVAAVVQETASTFGSGQSQIYIFSVGGETKKVGQPKAEE